MTYVAVLTDHDPVHGGKVESFGWPTRQEATWYAEREVEAAKELGFKHPVTFEIRRAS